MKNDFLHIVGAAVLVGLVLAGPASARAQGRDEVRQALYAGTYDKAIALALEALGRSRERRDPLSPGPGLRLFRAAGRRGSAPRPSS